MANIMIVDDNPDIVITLKMLMEAKGHITETSYNGEEFLSKVETVKPDLVLLDVMMPGLKTREILQGLKKKGLHDVKVILVTVVRFSPEERETLFNDFGIKDYVAKPFDVTDLSKRVQKALGSLG